MHSSRTIQRKFDKEVSLRLAFCYIMILMKRVNVIGAGLSGSEAAYYLLKKGYEVHLYEKRPVVQTPAHSTGLFGELVCSNSLKSNRLDNACGLLKEEMRNMDSLIMKIAAKTSVPSGNALSVDRILFAQGITDELKSFKNLIIHNEDVETIPEDFTIIATGPLTSDKLANELSKIIGTDNLFFFDASAPIIEKDSIDMSIAYKKARYDQGDDSYINCPFSKEEYDVFYNELINAKLAKIHEFDKAYFEGCMPIEVMAKRGYDTLRYGPLKPKGLQLMDRPKAYAVLQLRQDNLLGNLYNIVGFQTNLTYQEQKRVFSLIPGLENAKFVRYGLMHRNNYICSPIAINKDLSLKNKSNIFIAGQLSGVEGYVESSALGILSAVYAHLVMSEKEINPVPNTTILGSLYNYICNANPKDFSPMNANFGILTGANKYNHEECIQKSLFDIKKWWTLVNDK